MLHMRDSYVILLICMFSLSSCAGRQEVLVGDYSFPVIPADDTLCFNDVFSSYEVIQLKDAVVSGVRDVVLLDSAMILRGTVNPDEDESDKFAVGLFSRKGEFLRPIVRIGRGPEELLTIEDMCLNKYCNTLDILCNYGQNIYRYDLQDFSLKDRLSLDSKDIVSATGIAPVDSSCYLVYKQYPYSKSQDYKLYLYDAETGDVKNRFLPMNEKLAENLAFSQDNNVYEFDGAVYYYEAFGKCIYRYSQGGMVPYVTWAENKYSLPDNILEEAGPNIMEFVQMLQQSPYVWGHINFYRCGNRFFSTYMCGKNCYLNIIDLDKESSSSYSCIKDDMIWNVITDDVRGVFMPAGAGQDWFAYVVEPFVMKELVSSSDSVDSESYSLLTSLPDDANPLIIIVK